MWIYVYKFDKHARLVKCKARIVIRRDQQSRSKMESTYAATLAARSFRTFMAIAARFDLELKQYDAVRDQARLPAEFTTRPQPKRHKWMTGRSSISAYYIACPDQGPDRCG